jgi:hypothetical protein
MPMRGLHRRVAEVALEAAAPHGFALGGGNALITYGLIERLTQDVDLFSNDEHGVQAASDDVEGALRSAGFAGDRRDMTAGLSDIFEEMGQGLAEWLLRAPGGERTMLQLAYFERTQPPVMLDVGPVLHLEDVVGGKVCALASRIEPRDYVDTAAALRHFSIDEVIGFARRLDPGLTHRDFADAGRQLDRWTDDAFVEYGFGPDDVAELRRQFAGWPRS